ncbi:MAG TPA: hypothetical protein VNW68_06100 [Candidatus Limnocylindria bacterium]|jgi:hypothetical protein|nr:hypothetical protein [Candidatus Limnocylindria bacterium]
MPAVVAGLRDTGKGAPMKKLTISLISVLALALGACQPGGDAPGQPGVPGGGEEWTTTPAPMPGGEHGAPAGDPAPPLDY